MKPHKDFHAVSDGTAAPAQENDQLVVVLPGPRRPYPKMLGDRLGQLFLAWAWNTQHRDWTRALRTLARSLKGLEGEGLIERQRTRGMDGRVLHLVRVTPLGRSALTLLGGDDSGCE